MDVPAFSRTCVIENGEKLSRIPFSACSAKLPAGPIQSFLNARIPEPASGRCFYRGSGNNQLIPQLRHAIEKWLKHMTDIIRPVSYTQLRAHETTASI